MHAEAYALCFGLAATTQGSHCPTTPAARASCNTWSSLDLTFAAPTGGARRASRLTRLPLCSLALGLRCAAESEAAAAGAEAGAPDVDRRMPSRPHASSRTRVRTSVRAMTAAQQQPFDCRVEETFFFLPEDFLEALASV
eukprot:CAMPEP_0176236748 /NCGR_PEP_ID=MMETSP0121_2-20121125/27498_1 /TAXON_ID=160619 /ORGANISM="Kryptoperidinium foliaceum, Strain CCMP 1326" /LENGTH=139 /DNA_ID=CAMNT_0017576179 /DNA_START=88 /DNA_END=504 /DNA_ORIENTATION=-